MSMDYKIMQITCPVFGETREIKLYMRPYVFFRVN